jgi:hypothetical protein
MISSSTLELCICIILTTYLAYHLFHSPTSHFPGPWYSKFTGLYLLIQEFRGRRRVYIHALHEKYGSVVRLGPNEVSFLSKDAVREIYTSGGSGFDKTRFYSLFMQFETR